MALRGKVPVKVIGKVAKGDVLITSNVAGYAISAGSGADVFSSAVLAKALESKEDDSEGLIMAVIV